MNRTITSERGFALISSLLLLMIITIIAISMFRSFATQEHVAGNVREKERALHAAESAQQYAEWWLANSPNTSVGAQTCVASVSASYTQGQICNQLPAFPFTTVGPTGWAIQVSYLPPGMCVTGCPAPAPNVDPPYALTPGFYITDLGRAADNLGEAYQIDAYGSGSTAIAAVNTTVAVVESTYEIQQGVNCLSCG